MATATTRAVNQFDPDPQANSHRGTTEPALIARRCRGGLSRPCLPRAALRRSSNEGSGPPAFLTHVRSWQHAVPEGGGLLPTGGRGVKDARPLSAPERIPGVARGTLPSRSDRGLSPVPIGHVRGNKRRGDITPSAFSGSAADSSPVDPPRPAPRNHLSGPSNTVSKWSIE